MLHFYYHHVYKKRLHVLFVVNEICCDKARVMHFRDALYKASRHIITAFGSPRSTLPIKPRMYADGLLSEAATTTP